MPERRTKPEVVMEKDEVRRGRMLLMLRLPALRDKLTTDSSSNVIELIETYDIAHSAQLLFRAEGEEIRENEYREICLEIEEEITSLLTAPPS